MLRIETYEEKFEMLRSIINDGATWEYQILECPEKELKEVSE